MSADRDRPDEDVDAAFARIIAGWDDTPGAPGVQERTGPPDGPTDAAVPPSPDPPSQDPPPPGPPSSPAAVVGPPDPGPRDWAVAPEPDEGFVPPDPPPLPPGDLTSRLSWAGVLLGPAFLLLAGLVWRDVPRLWLGLAALAFIGGFVGLVMRLPADRDDQDPDDDGARL